MKNSMFKIKYLFNIENYISKRDYIFLFLVAILAVITSAFSGYHNLNLWDRLIETMQNPLTNILVFIGIILIILNVEKNICYNYLFSSRFRNNVDLIKVGILFIISSVMLFYLVFFILAFAGSIFSSLGNYTIGLYEKYNISSFIYIIFRFIRNILIYVEISILFFLLFYLKKRFINFFALLFTIVGYFLSYSNILVNHFYQIPFFFQAYLTNTDFRSFYIEFIVSLIYIFILKIFLRVTYNYCIKRRNVLNENAN